MKRDDKLITSRCDDTCWAWKEQVVMLVVVMLVVMVVGVDRGKRNPICWSSKGGSE